MITADQASQQAYDTLVKLVEKSVIDAVIQHKKTCTVSFKESDIDQDHLMNLYSALRRVHYNVEMTTSASGYVFFEISW